jgi:hypothetical protein
LASKIAGEVVVACALPKDAIRCFLLFLKKDNLNFFQKKERRATERST